MLLKIWTRTQKKTTLPMLVQNTRQNPQNSASAPEHQARMVHSLLDDEDAPTSKRSKKSPPSSEPRAARARATYQERKTMPCTYDGCSRMFSCQFNVDQHIREKHTEERPFVCEKCGADFARFFTLKRHQDLDHDKIKKSSRRRQGQKTGRAASTFAATTPATLAETTYTDAGNDGERQELAEEDLIWTPDFERKFIAEQEAQMAMSAQHDAAFGFGLPDLEDDDALYSAFLQHDAAETLTEPYFTPLGQTIPKVESSNLTTVEPFYVMIPGTSIRATVSAYEGPDLIITSAPQLPAVDTNEVTINPNDLHRFADDPLGADLAGMFVENELGSPFFAGQTTVGASDEVEVEDYDDSAWWDIPA
ncbi:hypothetical protein BT93_L5456 [Corymbia citriodora subsp. variegata]|uniref:C2H2-type domain-containing protein n=1 Tax=Corymbia citriodora subsp. variegata TaxID=360336 RepID=A0A8T0CJR9_CORYI|nr:hypothetical protein BT93_L5456 [Corymbia citriodora subsp. variegata]